MTEATKRQCQVLEFIQDFQAANGAGPSIQEISEHCGNIGRNAAAGHIKALERKGLLKKVRSSSGRALARAYIIDPGKAGEP